jgi:hypothetical protein
MGRYRQPCRTDRTFLIIRTRESPGYWLAKELPGEAPGWIRVQWMAAINVAEGHYRLVEQEGVIHEDTLLAYDVWLLGNKLKNDYFIDRPTLLDLTAHVATEYEN